MKKAEFRNLIREEIRKVLSEGTYEKFKQDFDNVVKFASVSLDKDIVTIYLDNDPNKEKNLINKLVRTKYLDSLKKIASEEDVMKFKIIKP
jgi:hypothetical protein